MRVQYVSDLHTEYMSPELQIPAMVRNIREGVPDCDTLVLAGDIGSYMYRERLKVFLDLICPLYKHVIYIMGNHEYYCTMPDTLTLQTVNAYYKGLETMYPNITVLMDEDVLIEDKVFAGCTLWFDTENPFAVTRRGYLNDYYRIPEAPLSIGSMAAASLEYVTNLVEGGPGRIDLMICHHGVASVFHERYRNSDNNVFFYRDISKLIEKLDVGRIIHGHQHSNHSYDLPCNVQHNPEQRVIVSTNCKGYPDEHPEGFSYGAYVDI